MRHFLALGKLVSLVVSMALVALAGKSLAETPDYPLKRGPNPRYLVDQNDRPFLIQGDTAWSLLVQATREEAEQYLRNRHSKGFNSIIVNLTEHWYCDNPPLNRYGDPPFTTPGDYATPNPAYFAHVDWVLKKAAHYGIAVFLAPSYLGYNGGFDDWYEPVGWYQEMRANGVTKMRDFGRFLGQRYKDFDNIIWLHGGDYNPPEPELVNAIAEGILEFDPNHLHTVHCAAEFSGLDYYPSESWLQLNSTYTYSDILNKSRTDYARNPAYPFFLIESTYEGDRNAPSQEIRRQAYWPIFSGACGQFVGVSLVWGYYPGWQQAMDGVASRDMANLRRLLDSRPWWTFVPDLNNTIVVAGFGDLHSSDPSQFYVTAARTPDGASFWAFIPTGRTITVNMSRISGATVQTWWYSPRTGNATPIGQFANIGLRDFTTPASEGATQDWILVADDASRSLPPPGMTTIADWRATYFSDAELRDPLISGNLPDPDRDGRSNAMEYALLTDPTVADADLAPTEVSLVTAEHARLLKLAYTRRKNAVDLVFGAKVSPDLQSWTALEAVTTLDQGLTETVAVQDNTPTSIASKRFLRFEVNVTP
jgi:hypothetical protein